MKTRIVSAILAILNTVLLASAANSQESQIQPVNALLLKQVGYGDVLKLPQQPALTSHRYGEAKEHFAEGWPGIANTNLDLVFIHGGCWLSEYGLDHARGLMSAFAQRGYNVWSLEYRRTGTTLGGWPTSFNDLNDALESLKNNQLIRPEKTVVLGHSAGGHLALLLGAKHPELHAVIGLAPIYDLPAYALGDNSCQKSTPLFMNGLPTERAQDYRDANPAVQPLHPNTFIFAGGADAIVPLSQFQQLHNQSVIKELRIIEEAGHFDFIHPDSEAWHNIFAVLNEL